MEYIVIAISIAITPPLLWLAIREMKKIFREMLKREEREARAAEEVEKKPR